MTHQTLIDVLIPLAQLTLLFLIVSVCRSAAACLIVAIIMVTVLYDVDTISVL